jgi:two-component system, OmpR family, KDP operon response regulator KdpE
VGYAPRILIVEDEPEVRRFFETVLLEQGYCVTPVGTARHALRVVSDFDCDVAIVDMSLPDMSGPDAIQCLLVERPYIKVLAVSGAMGGIMGALAKSAGASAVLSKPMTMGKLLSSVYDLIDPSGSWRG